MTAAKKDACAYRHCKIEWEFFIFVMPVSIASLEIIKGNLSKQI